MLTVFRVVFVALLIGAGIGSCVVSPAAAQNTPPAPECHSEPLYRGFDFWIGSWDVFAPNGNRAGSNQIERAESGCLLLERWTSSQGGTGTSMNYVDPVDGRWRQIWMDGGGNVIHLAGGLEHGAMKLSGELIDPQGNRSGLRGTWTPLGDGSVRQLFEQSLDGGRTWSTWFDGYYRKPMP
ncbi:MAG: hypothetical protein SH809_00270 [Rhodothermales bacterium]|nr:hypothetical protein [Rhodothermales bacterium]